MATSDPSCVITVNLTEPFEAALRRAALKELDGAADDITIAIAGTYRSDPSALDEARSRIADAGLLLDQLGYTIGDEPIEALTAPVAALSRAATRALDDLQDEIREPGHEHSPSGLRASAELWDQLEDLAERASAVAS